MFFLLFSSACLPLLHSSITFIPGQSHGVGKQLPPYPAGALRPKEGQKKWRRGVKSWSEERSQSPLELSVHRRLLPQAAVDEQQNTETVGMNTLMERKGRKPLCDQKSTKELEAEICWAFLPCVSTLTENPDQIMRGKGSHCLLILLRLGLI